MVRFCPACDQELILKVGAKKIPHFAHKTLCPIKPEGESEIHLLGKKKLYTWLKRMGFQPEIERYLTNVNQQPDLLFSWQGRNCVIEFQCSIISPAEIMRRTKNYLENDYHPFWIIYDKNITSSANETIHFSEFLAQFLLKISETSSLILSFDPECDSLHAFYHIIPHSLNRAWATKYKLTKKEQLATLFSPPPLLNFSFTAWVNKTESWLYYLSLKPKARQNKFLQFLYQSYLHPLVLPPEVGIPLPNMYLIHSHPFEWQFYLWYHLLFQKN